MGYIIIHLLINYLLHIHDNDNSERDKEADIINLVFVFNSNNYFSF